MFKRKKDKRISKFAERTEETRIIDISYIMGNKKEIIIRNLIAGVARGVGIGIGITIISAIIIYFLRKLIMLNIPVLGDYITDIVSIVQKSL